MNGKGIPEAWRFPESRQYSIGFSRRFHQFHKVDEHISLVNIMCPGTMEGKRRFAPGESSLFCNRYTIRNIPDA